MATTTTTCTTVHERQVGGEDAASQPFYCLKRPVGSNSDSHSSNSGELRHLNCYGRHHKKIPFNSTNICSCNCQSTDPRSNFLIEAQKRCPHLNVPQLFERYCVLSGKAKEAMKCDDLSLVCSIPILREKNAFKVQLSGCGGNQQLWAGKNRDELWTHLYAPMKVEQMMSNSSACKVLVEWLRCFKPSEAKRIHHERAVFTGKKLLLSNGLRRNVKKRNYCCSDEEEDVEEEEFPTVAVLHGNYGTGKTAAVYACAAEAGLEVFEINSSILRSRTQIIKKLREAFQSCQVRPSTLCGLLRQQEQPHLSISQSTVILVDEVDVIFEEDAGFLQALQEVVEKSSRPVILTSSDYPADFKLQALSVHFKSPSELDMGVHLSLLSHAHQVCLPLSVACEWSRSVRYDIRKALLHAQCALTSTQRNPLSSDLPSPRLLSWPSSHGGTVSDLVSLSKKCDHQVSLDLLSSATASVDPGKARLLPGLLDSSSQSQLCHVCPLNLSTHIFQTLDCPPESSSKEDDGVSESKATLLEAAAKLFSKQCSLYQKDIMTDYLPFLKWMYLCENANRRAENKRRRSRHYLQSSLSDLKFYFCEET